SMHMFASFFHDTATTEHYTLSLHDALPISQPRADRSLQERPVRRRRQCRPDRFRPDGHEQRLVPVRRDERRCPAQEPAGAAAHRSEEHTSELQSRENLVCRLLLEKKKKIAN